MPPAEFKQLVPEISADLSCVPGIAHGFFSRRGGVSGGIYAGLNCGFGSADVTGHVAENRARVARHLDVSASALLTLYQIHSAHAVTVTAPWTPEAAPRADAMVTDRTGIALGVLAADCAPVLLCDPHARVIGAAHSGWKGALNGVLEQTLDAMERLGAARAAVRAAIGPCLSVKNYEVGPEFRDRFVEAEEDFARFFSPSRDRGSGRLYFDLPALVAHRLERAGVAAVDRIGHCTYDRPERYFSYRRTTHRGEPDYGRNISAIVLTG